MDTKLQQGILQLNIVKGKKKKNHHEGSKILTGRPERVCNPCRWRCSKLDRTSPEEPDPSWSCFEQSTGPHQSASALADLLEGS